MYSIKASTTDTSNAEINYFYDSTLINWCKKFISSNYVHYSDSEFDPTKLIKLDTDNIITINIVVLYIYSRLFISLSRLIIF